MPFLPHQAAAACIKRSRRFLACASAVLPEPKIKNDLRRMALVMAVAAVDSYMHGMVLRRLSRVRSRASMPKPLREVGVPFEDLASLADTSLQVQRSGQRSRPWVQVKNSLKNVLLQQTFQSYDQVGRAFALAGVSKGWSKVATQIGESDAFIRQRLNTIVHRRNQIVHEGDLMRVSRPQRLKFNAVTSAGVTSEVDWIDGLINAVHIVISAEP